MKKFDSTVYTKNDFKYLFKQVGVEKGMVVCLQANLSHFGTIVGGAQAMIDALKDLIGDEGCIIMPSFSMSVLDPACEQQQTFPLESWEVIRKNMIGFNKFITPCDRNSRTCNQLLRNVGVVRSEHPVYSFSFLGNYEEDWLDQNLDFPIEFESVLSAFRKHKACNVLIGVPFEQSVLLHALSHMLGMETTRVERAYEKKGKRNVAKTFLINDIDLDCLDDLKSICQIQSRECMDEWIHSLSLYNNLDSILDMLTIVS